MVKLLQTHLGRAAREEVNRLSGLQRPLAKQHQLRKALLFY